MQTYSSHDAAQRAKRAKRAKQERDRRRHDPYRISRTSYAAMLQRCRDPQYPNWVSVSICERWRLPDGVGFKNFLADLGERPVDEPATSRTRTGKIIYQTLGRYRDQGDYEPGNCEWMTQERQAHHQGPRSAPGGQPSSSRFKGVHRDKNSWRAAIRVDGKHRHLGSFVSEDDAARAYDAAARQAWREDCYLNFPSASKEGTQP